jgi:hypothetical protein
MGGKSETTQSQSSQTDPWDVAQPMLQGILGKLNPMIQDSGLSGTASGAIDQLQANAQQGNPYAGQIDAFTKSLLAGGGANDQAGNINSNLSTYQNQLTPYANGSMIGNNPALKAQLDTIMSDVGNSVNGQFAAAGRDMSGANQQAYGRGVAQGVAPVLANQYNQDVNNQINAAGSLYGAGNTSAGMLSGLNQQGLTNQLQGVATSNDALGAQNYGAQQTLQLEQLRKSLPAETLGLLAQIGIPIAGLGSQSTGQSQGTQKMSGAQQFGLIANGIGSMMPKAPVSFGGGGSGG